MDRAGVEVQFRPKKGMPGAVEREVALSAVYRPAFSTPLDHTTQRASWLAGL
jgi:hypothetical protein